MISCVKKLLNNRGFLPQIRKSFRLSPMEIINRAAIIFVGLCLVCILDSCYSPVEGCLDPESVNYSIAGDEDCEDCCEYPTIKVSIFHQNADTTLFLADPPDRLTADTLINNLNQKYSIIEYVYLLSDFKILTSDDQTYEVEDSIQLDIGNDTKWTKDDVIRVKRSIFSYDFGTIIFDGAGVELSFKVGIPALLNDNRFTDEISSHPLTTDPDSLFQEDLDEYVFQRIQVAQGEEFKDTVIYNVFGNENLQTVSFPVAFDSEKGKDKTIIIEARYNEWFDEVNFDNMTKDAIEAIIASKSATMFGAHE